MYLYVCGKGNFIKGMDQSMSYFLNQKQFFYVQNTYFSKKSKKKKKSDKLDIWTFGEN